jgi:hypothetical protein
MPQETRYLRREGYRPSQIESRATSGFVRFLTSAPASYYKILYLEVVLLGKAAGDSTTRESETRTSLLMFAIGDMSIVSLS